MLHVYIALFALLVPALSTAGNPLPVPRQVSDHAWAWIGPYGPPTKENQGFRMNLRRLAETKLPDCVGFLFVFQARQQEHSRAM